jgi:hypothetical protein
MKTTYQQGRCYTFQFRNQRGYGIHNTRIISSSAVFIVVALIFDTIPRNYKRLPCSSLPRLKMPTAHKLPTGMLGVFSYWN